MCSSTDHKMWTGLISFLYIAVTLSQGKIQSPNKYYAVTSSTVEIPCVIDSPRGKPRWYPERPGQARTGSFNSYKDPQEPDLFLYVIRNVQVSDAGRYICTDGRQNTRTELIVTEPSHVQDVEARTSGPDEVKVTWKSPLNNPDAVVSYNVYVEEVTEPGKEAKFKVDTVNPNGIEEFPLTDFSPGATYRIQVTAVYLNGTDDLGETIEGPRSPPVEITTPQFETAPWKVMAEPGANSSIKVTWRIPQAQDTRGVDGYIVYYQGVGKKDMPTGEVTVSPPQEGDQGEAILKGLKLKLKYKIRVAAFTGGRKKIAGPSSDEVIFAHDGFNPELSIRAVALSPTTVLVSLDTVGGNKLDKLRLFYSDNSAIKWDKVEGYNTKEKYALVTGLQPRTRYFFSAKASVNSKARSIVTHVLTPPAELSAPKNVQVTAKSASSVLVSWDYQADAPAKGFVVHVDKQQAHDADSPGVVAVVHQVNEALVEDLVANEKYEVKVEPFDTETVGTCGDPILFQLSDNGQPTEPAPETKSPPEFVDVQPVDLQIDRGQDIRLRCTAIGHPAPTVQWFKDNVAITEPVSNVNELVLSGVMDPVLLTCIATNSEGFVESHTHVQFTQEIEVPRFVNRLPETVVVNRGADMRQLCEATGYPVPNFTWLKDGKQVRPEIESPGQSVYMEKRIQRPFNLTCVASNADGWVESAIQVYIQELLRKPTLKNRLPRSMSLVEGNPLNVTCIYQGNPVPQVSWYDGTTRLVEPTPGQSVLSLDTVDRSTHLTCKGENLAGSTEESINVVVSPKRETVTPENRVTPDYKVTLKVRSDSPTDARVKWNVDRGNLNDIRRFDLKLFNDKGHEMISQPLNSQQRTMNLKRLLPNVRYIVELQTTGAHGVVDRCNADFTTQDKGTSSNIGPVMYLDIVEIRDTTARLDYWTENIDPRRLLSYSLDVNDLGVQSFSNTILSQKRLPLDTPTIALDRLKPYSHYQVIMEAVSKQGVPVLSVSANFSTPGPGQYVDPVSVSSVNGTSAPTTPTTPTTVTKQPIISNSQPESTSSIGMKKTRPTTEQPPEDTTQPLTIDVTTVVIETSQPDDVITTEDPDEHDYLMTAKIPNKTPFKVDIRWAVDRGPLENIKDFTVTIKGMRNQTLLKQTLPANQRYITIQSLNPDTNYFVNVQANGPDGVLADSDVHFKTDPADTVEDTSMPSLELEANEVRAENARIEWTVVKADPELVKGYRLQVLDGGPGAMNLLTQQMPANLQSMYLQQLQPNKRYHVIVDALADDGSVLMSSSLTFQTAAPNRYGVPVFSSSSMPQNTGRSLQHPHPETEESSRPQDDRTPALDFMIYPERASTVLTWKTKNVAPGIVSGYTIKIKEIDGRWPDGRLLLDKTLPSLAYLFRVDGLLNDR